LLKVYSASQIHSCIFRISREIKQKGKKEIEKAIKGEGNEKKRKG